MKIAEFANSIDLDEVAHNEPPHLDLHCLPSSHRILHMIQLGFNIFLKLADETFVVCFLVVKELTKYLVKVSLSLLVYIKSSALYILPKKLKKAFALQNQLNFWGKMAMIFFLCNAFKNFWSHWLMTFLVLAQNDISFTCKNTCNIK